MPVVPDNLSVKTPLLKYPGPANNEPGRIVNKSLVATLLLYHGSNIVSTVRSTGVVPGIKVICVLPWSIEIEEDSLRLGRRTHQAHEAQQKQNLDGARK